MSYPCQSVCLPALHSHLHCLQCFSHSWKLPEREVQGRGDGEQEEEEGKWEVGAVTKCSLIIFHSLFFHPVSLHLPLLSSRLSSSCIFPLLLLLFTSLLRLPSSSFWRHFHSLPLFSSRYCFFSLFFCFFFFLGRREEEWRVAMATVSWLQSYLFAGLQRKRANETDGRVRDWVSR